MPDARFLLIRHAQSEWNAVGRWQGHADPPLSSRGREQAAALARELAGESVDRLLASDLERARETAAAVGRVWGLAPRHDARLRELHVGAWTGLTREEIEEKDRELLLRFESGEPFLPAGAGESRAEVRRRVRRFVADLARENPGRRIAIVTHLGVIRALRPGTAIETACFVRASARELTLSGTRGVEPAGGSAY